MRGLQLMMHLIMNECVESKELWQSRIMVAPVHGNHGSKKLTGTVSTGSAGSICSDKREVRPETAVTFPPAKNVKMMVNEILIIT
jgi:hypothetical protein